MNVDGAKKPLDHRTAKSTGTFDMSFAIRSSSNGMQACDVMTMWGTAREQVLLQGGDHRRGELAGPRAVAISSGVEACQLRCRFFGLHRSGRSKGYF